MKKLILSILLLATCSIATHAQNETVVCSGEDVYYHIQLPQNTTVQWEESGDGINYTAVPGAVGDTLSLLSVQNSRFYRAVMFDSICNGYSSEIYELIVNPLPILAVNNLSSIYCVDEDSVHLTGQPQGGTFSGPGITGNTFVPSDAGVGNHGITYSYTDSNNCSSDTTYYSEVKPLPAVALAGIVSAYCIEDSNTVQPITNPQGGSLTGAGIAGDSLRPWMPGIGTHTVYYTYTDSFGCSNTDSAVYSVVSPPSQAFAGSDTATTSTSVQLNADLPAQGTGTWSVHSGTGGSFSNINDPQSTFTGQSSTTYELIWTVSSQPCGSTTDTVIVDITAPPLPAITCNGQTLYIHPVDNHGPIAWGCQGVVAGASSDTDGASNTAAVVSSCNPPTAANICDTLTAFGHSDWYLPAYDELDCMRNNAAAIGGFSNDTYWSSTEGTGIFTANARYRAFPSGVSGFGSKTNTHRVRCVRK